LTGGLAPTQASAPPVPVAAPLTGAYAPKDPNGLLTPSDVNPTEIRAAVETPTPTYAPRRHAAVHRHAAHRGGEAAPDRAEGYFGF